MSLVLPKPRLRTGSAILRPTPQTRIKDASQIRIKTPVVLFSLQNLQLQETLRRGNRETGLERGRRLAQPAALRPVPII